MARDSGGEASERGGLRSARWIGLWGAAFASGAAALVYQVAWVRQLGTLIGSTTYAVNVVLSVFFLGLGVGAWLVGRRVDRRRASLRPFFLLEGAIAVSGVLFWPLSRWIDAVYVSLAPSEWPLARSVGCHALITLLLLFVPTFCMGGTLPVLVAYASAARARFTRDLGLLYGINTIGAAFGAAAAVFLLLPRLGLTRTGLAAAALNGVAILCAVVARGRAGGPRATPPERRAPAGAPAPSLSPRLVLVVAAWSGFVSVGLEVLWTRALATRFLSTIYSFATILVVFLACLGLGSLLVQALARRRLLGGGAVAAVLIVSGLGGLASLGLLSLFPMASAGAGGEGFAVLQLRELAQTVAIVALPTLLFGLNFPLLCHVVHQRGIGPGRSVGTVYLANTCGSVVAPLLFGFVLIPAFGMRLCLIAASWAALALGLAVSMRVDRARSAPARSRLTAATALIAAVLTFAPRGELGLWRESSGDTLLYYRDGVSASVAVVDSPDGGRLLKIDNTYHLGGTRQGFAQTRQGLLPLLLAPAPERVLFIGLATGSSAGPAAATGGLATDVLEIVPGLAPVLPLFGDVNEGLAERFERDPLVRLLEVDGRHFVRTTPRAYDVVVGDLFVPWRAGEGSMYAREHLAAVRDVLSPEGLFCQWLPLYQLRAPELRTIVATFCEVFPAVEAFWLYFNVEQPVVGLVGSNRPLSLDPAQLRGRVASAETLFERSGLADPRALCGSWIAGRETLVRWAAGAPLETHDRPRVEFDAPHSRFGSASPPAAENVPLLVELTRPLSESGLLRSADADERAQAERYQRSIRSFFRGRHALVHRGDAMAAVDDLADALRETPGWDWIGWNLDRVAQDALRAGATEVARAAAQALQESPDFRPAGLTYAGALALGANDLTEARRQVEAALALDPEHRGSRMLLEEIERREQGGVPAQRHPDVVEARASRAADGTWRFDVTLSSTYDAPERYADAWRILAPDGTELGVRVLTHDHADEQPFTRSLGGVAIPAEVTRVVIQGRDLHNGWGGATVEVALDDD